MPPLPLLIRILITWLVIFPLVAIAQALLAPLLRGWPPVAITAVVVSLVVPIAVTWAVPWLTRLYLRIFRREPVPAAEEG